MSTTGDTPLGEVIKKAIEATGMTYAAVAKKMGVSRQAIFKVDKRKNFDLEFLQKLKVATGLDYTNFIFNPKSKLYEPFEFHSISKEPLVPYELANNTIELSLSLKIKAQDEDLSKLSELIASFKGEAKKYGFILK